MRGAAAGRGIAWTLGAVVLVAVVVGVVVAGGGGSPSFGGSGESSRAQRRQARQDARASACDAEGAPAPNGVVAGAAAPADGAQLAPAPPAAYDAATDAAPPGVYDAPAEAGGELISRAELHEAILPHVGALRACAPTVDGTLVMDARIDGATGRVSGIVLQGPIAESVPTVCVSLVTANIQVRTFEGVADVRWGVRFPE